MIEDVNPPTGFPAKQDTSPRSGFSTQAGSVRSAQRTRFVRCWFCRPYQGPAQPSDSAGCGASITQHGPSGCVWLRGQHGGWGGHPHRVAARVSAASGCGRIWESNCPNRVSFAAGNVFLPTIESEREQCKAVVEALVDAQGLRLVGWRPVPTDGVRADIGPTAKAAEPRIEQLVIAAGPESRPRVGQAGGGRGQDSQA